jgi:hypothetical protein
MESKFSSKLQFANASLIAALAVTGSAAAQTLPKEGNYDFTSCFAGVMTAMGISKTEGAFTFEMTGTNVTNPPGGMFDKVSYRCIGYATSFGGKVTNESFCEAVDKGGDKLFAKIALGSDGMTSNREVLAGTGKYEGIVSKGTAVSMGPFPVAKPGTFQNCARQTGTYKLK